MSRVKIFIRSFFLFLFCYLFLFSLTAASASSLWNENSASPYSTQKAYKTGDIINVIILESSSAKNVAGTKTNLKDDLGVKFNHTIQRLAPIIGTNVQAAGQVYDNYSGGGNTSRGSNVSARVAAWVVDVLPNGNLLIKGNHRVDVNNESQEITITGIVRPKDISGANTIFSYQVANAKLAVNGTGAVADSSEPGWITRLFNWLF